MFKYIGGFILFLFLFIGSILFLLFTNNGNMFLKPYISSYLSQKTKMNIDINSFTLKPNFLDLEAYINKKDKIILNGNINIFKEQFDLDFFSFAKDLLSNNGNKNSIDLRGKIVGNVDNFKIYGNGIVFNSKADFEANIIKFKVQNLHLQIKQARIDEILSFFGKKPYISGIANININFNNLNLKNLNGKATIDIPYASIDTFLVKKDFNITLPVGMILKAKTFSVLKNKQIISTIKIDSNIAKINTNKTIYNLQTGSFLSDYDLKISDLSLLRDLVSKKLQGSFEAKGKIKKENQDLSYLVSTYSFGGKTIIVGLNKAIQIDAKNVKLDKILYLLNEPKYSYGNININGEFYNIDKKNMNGDLKINFLQSTLNHALIKKDFNITIPNNFSYTIFSNMKVENQKTNFSSDINSSIGNLKIYKGEYNISNNKLEAKYILNIPSLENLYFLTKKDIKTPLKAKGNIQYLDNIFASNGKSDILDTNTTYQYKDGNLTFNCDNINTLNFSKAFNYPLIFDSNGNFRFFYNLKNKKGNFDLLLKNGKMKQNSLSDIIFSLSGFDLTKEIYNNGILKGNIEKNMINFSFDLNSSKTLIKAYNGKFDLNNSELSTDYMVKIDNKDIEGKIKGNIDHPKVTIDSSSYIKNKLEKIIDKKIPKKYQESLKQILNLF